jgi:hypothetical protein
VNSDRKTHDPVNPTWLPAPVGHFTGLVFSALFALGVLLVIVFQFFPLIDHAKIARKKAEMDVARSKEKQLDEDVEDEIKNLKLDDSRAAELRQKRAQERTKSEAERLNLEQKLRELQVNVEANPYWYWWGTMLGFISLAFGGLGYLNFGHTASVRVAGGVLVVGIVLLIFVHLLQVGVGR